MLFTIALMGMSNLHNFNFYHKFMGPVIHL
jgi:hypothetical protein